jgi:hypothetical protein
MAHTRGSLYKRCGCRDPLSTKRLGTGCPHLAEPEHGTWSFACTVRSPFTGTRRVRRGGYVTRGAAKQARNRLLAQNPDERVGQLWTVEQWLRYWLLLSATRVRPSTLRNYQAHVESYLIPACERLANDPAHSVRAALNETPAPPSIETAT